MVKYTKNIKEILNNIKKDKFICLIFIANKQIINPTIEIFSGAHIIKALYKLICGVFHKI